VRATGTRRSEGLDPMNRKWRDLIKQRAGALGLVVLACGMVLQAPHLGADETAPPARAVRLSSVDGQVQIFQGNQVLADPAVANTPLFEGSRIVTGNDGRAEVQFEDGSVARLSPSSSLTLTVLRGQGTASDAEISLNSGLGYFEIQGASESNQIRVRFGDTVATASGFTVLRVNLDKPPGEVAVFSGNAHIEGGASPALDLHGGESVALNSADPSNFNLTESIEPDSWDAWNSDRDQALNSAAAGRTAATSSLPDSNNPAWGDLDANGNWYDVPDQGYVWSPYEASAPGWDPYGTGNWMWTPQYGYGWVSGETWGYMPYQCGAWNYYNQFGWGWAPGICQTWWGGGGGWAFNIGIAPPRYRYPIRPRNPRPMEVGRGSGPQPIIPVNRRVQAGNTVLPNRDRNSTVTIAGNVVQPLRPVQVRPPYNRSDVTTYSNRSMPVSQASRSLGSQGYSGSWPAARPGSQPTAPRPSSSSYARPSAPTHSSPAPSAPAVHSAPSGGGGGGGGSHPSGGGSHH
jgi:ferric-dicitrate binding protein FerR (iron transport regulator)